MVSFGTNPALHVQCQTAGPCALRNGESGQVGNEAATANLRECRSQGSPFLSVFPHFFHVIRHIVATVFRMYSFLTSLQV